MYKKNQLQSSAIKRNLQEEGESIEMKMQRVLSTKEPITDGAQLIYTERKDGVIPEYDPRTNKWDGATEALSQAAKNILAKRNATPTPETPSNQEGEKSAEPSQ